MLEYADEQMDFGRWDKCPVVVIFPVYNKQIVYWYDVSSHFA